MDSVSLFEMGFKMPKTTSTFQYRSAYVVVGKSWKDYSHRKLGKLVIQKAVAPGSIYFMAHRRSRQKF